MATRTEDRGIWRAAALTVPVIVIVGSVVGVISNSGSENGWYAALDRPGFQPPDWAFGVVWTTLYTMTGIALAVVLRAPKSGDRTRGLFLFGAQLFLNFAWSPVFFVARAIDPALVVIVFMTILLVATIISFWRIRPLAGALLLPYLAWLILATALNHETGRLNPGAGTYSLGITGA